MEKLFFFSFFFINKDSLADSFYEEQLSSAKAIEVQIQTQWRKLILAAHPGSYKHYKCYLADHQRGTCNLRGIRRRLALKVEGLKRVLKHA